MDIVGFLEQRRQHIVNEAAEPSIRPTSDTTRRRDGPSRG